MARHEVGLRVPHEIVIGNTDVEFRITADGELLGRIRISRGTIDFLPYRKKSAYKLRWKRFAELMEEYGTRVSPRDPR
ncbi:MAG: hypothetical protein E6G08_20625 [Actinobacteria bacterium]|jgi:hypothetical protein|nr:MAG: hypothetical protein E6G08_20625 [Actinomycetota bacterium]